MNTIVALTVDLVVILKPDNFWHKFFPKKKTFRAKFEGTIPMPLVEGQYLFLEIWNENKTPLKVGMVYVTPQKEGEEPFIKTSLSASAVNTAILQGLLTHKSKPGDAFQRLDQDITDRLLHQGFTRQGSVEIVEIQ